MKPRYRSASAKPSFSRARATAGDHVPQRRRRLLEMTLSFEQLAEDAHRLSPRRTDRRTIRIGERAIT